MLSIPNETPEFYQGIHSVHSFNNNNIHGRWDNECLLLAKDEGLGNFTWKER